MPAVRRRLAPWSRTRYHSSTKNANASKDRRLTAYPTRRSRSDGFDGAVAGVAHALTVPRGRCPIKHKEKLVPLYRFEGKMPQIAEGTFVHPEAVLIGDVVIEEGCYIGAG